VKRLPYAPRPIEGEGLASWTARLAVHNFVEPAAFCDWLGVRDIADVAPTSEVVAQLAALAGIALDEVRGLVRAGPCGGRVWKADPNAFGLRGGACPTCCREAAEAGQDHWWPAESEALLRVSCPRHRCGLVTLDQLVLLRSPQGLRLMLPSDIPLGANRRNEPLVDPVLEMEAAIAGCLAGQRPSGAWRLQSPTQLLESVEVLIHYVLCAPIDELPFAHTFDAEPVRGGDVFRVSPSSPRRGVSSVQGQSARTRRNTLAALHALLASPSALTGDVAESRQWRTAPDSHGPYRLLIQNLGREGRARLKTEVPHLTAAIVAAARDALAAAAFENG
jgi:hypothetical protein